MRALGVDPVHDTRTTFRALVAATARPGTVQSVPVTPADHAVLATLVDHEVTLCTDDERLRTALSNAGRFEPAPFEEADVVHVDGSTDGRIERARRGTLKEPSDGAIAVYRVPALAGSGEGSTVREGTGNGERSTPDGTESGDAATSRSVPDDRERDWLRLRVEGPGVPGRRTVRVAGLTAAECESIAAAGAAYPRGVDVVFAADDAVAALPRSASVEVV